MVVQDSIGKCRCVPCAICESVFYEDLGLKLIRGGTSLGSGSKAYAYKLGSLKISQKYGLARPNFLKARQLFSGSKAKMGQF